MNKILVFVGIIVLVILLSIIIYFATGSGTDVAGSNAAAEANAADAAGGNAGNASGIIQADRVCIGTTCLETKDGRLEISKPVTIRSNVHQGLQIYGTDPAHNYLEFKRQSDNVRGRWVGYSGTINDFP